MLHVLELRQQHRLRLRTSSQAGPSAPSRRRPWRRLDWWIGVLFAIGSTCFFVGPFPGFVQLIGSAPDGTVFFVGSIFFTSAALLQYLQAANPDRKRGGGRMRLLRLEPRNVAWWSAGIQFIGTLFFNRSTFNALQTSLDTAATDRLVWRPDALGSICFLVSGALAYWALRGSLRHWLPRTYEARIAAINLAGCVFFGISAVTSFVVPETGDVVDLAASNVTTSLGALCFLIGALMLLPDREAAETEPAS